MRRDMDLVRRILLAVEEMPAKDKFLRIRPENWQVDPSDLAGHLDLLEKAKYLENDHGQARGRTSVYFAGNLTWKGHELLDAIRDDSVWSETKDIAHKAGGWTVDLLKDIAVGVIKTQIKKHSGVEV